MPSQDEWIDEVDDLRDALAELREELSAVRRELEEEREARQWVAEASQTELRRMQDRVERDEERHAELVDELREARERLATQGEEAQEQLRLMLSQLGRVEAQVERQTTDVGSLLDRVLEVRAEAAEGHADLEARLRVQEAEVERLAGESRAGYEALHDRIGGTADNAERALSEALSAVARNEELALDLRGTMAGEREARRTSLEAMGATAEGLRGRMESLEGVQEAFSLGFKAHNQAVTEEIAALTTTSEARLAAIDALMAQARDEAANALAEGKRELENAQKALEAQVIGRLAAVEEELTARAGAIAKDVETRMAPLLSLAAQLEEAKRSWGERLEAQREAFVTQLTEATGSWQLGLATSRAEAARALEEAARSAESEREAQHGVTERLASALDTTQRGLELQSQHLAELAERLGAVQAGSQFAARLDTFSEEVRGELESLGQLLAQLATQAQLLAHALDSVQKGAIESEIKANTWMREQLMLVRTAHDAIQRRVDEAVAGVREVVDRSEARLQDLDGRFQKAFSAQGADSQEIRQAVVALRESQQQLAGRVNHVVQLMLKAARPGTEP